MSGGRPAIGVTAAQKELGLWVVVGDKFCSRQHVALILDLDTAVATNAGGICQESKVLRHKGRRGR
ncbi:hypothetical protein D3C85_1530730 [compost metagenome]